MIRPDVAKWNQTVSALRRLSVEAEHPRTRERFLALYMMGSKHMNTTQWCEASRSALRTLLKQERLSWKKCQTLLKKASPEKRASFIRAFHELYEQVCREEIILLYLDQSRFHREMDLGYAWAPVGEVAWRPGSSLPLGHRINWFGAYDFNRGECFIRNEGNCNKETTVRFLRRLAAWLGEVSYPVVIIWDGARCALASRPHRSRNRSGSGFLPDALARLQS